ncbi:outer membrane beta-barrel family protein [Hymenobacter saemangeumensis]|uniref:Outer membrane beta-barrel family protein n=1 Tax=Hymenobacter saemangeumensis TaxID=1084522 RepID=A0ABP8IJU8_9BACT
MLTFLHPRRLLPAILLLGPLATQAQTRAALSGSLRSSTGAAVEFATVTLHRAADSSVVKTEFSDDKGAFRLEALSGARYLVSAAQVGFERYWSGPLELPAAGLSLAPIMLRTSAATALKEVTVTARRPLFERQADRTVVNVEGSTLAAGNTTLDVLSRSPGVTVDGNDNLGLRGRQGLLVLIDGKRQPMSGAELADLLRALPADQLKSIELITNPPARYDAQGSAGIIAINLKKDQRQGSNGSVNASYGRSQYNKLTGGLSLNHRKKKLNLFGSYSYANRENFGGLNLHRDFFNRAGQLIGTTDQQSRFVGHSFTHSWKTGADFSLTPKTTVGMVVNGLDNRNQSNGNNTGLIRNLARGENYPFFSASKANSYSPNAAANLNLRHAFTDSLGTHELTVDADYAAYRIDNDQVLRTYNNELLLNTVSNNQLGQLSIQSLKLDYTRPLSKQAQLEAGAKASLVTADNDAKFYTDGQYDLNSSNRFRYDENINAAYVNLNYTTPRLTLQAGLRGEQTNAVGKQDRSVEFQNFDRHYFQLFPSAAIKRTFSDKHELALSMSRRIDRPTYGSLNPFRQFIDRTTLQGGNPELLPQTSYNLELTHTFRQNYSLGLSYSVTSNPMIGVVQPASDSTVIATTRNLDYQHYYGLTATVPVQVAKWWNMYNNVVLYYNRFTGNLAGTNLNRGGVALEFSSSHTFTFGNGWSGELNGRYESRQVYGFLVQQPLGSVGAGLQKSLLDRKLNVKLAVADIFYTMPAHVTSSYSNYEEKFYQFRDTRVGTLSLSYRFGNDKVVPAKRRAGGAEEEKRRAG